MGKRDSVRVVEEFWAAVWQAPDPEAIDRFLVDDFVLTTGGVDVVSRAAFKEWAARFMAKVCGRRVSGGSIARDEALWAESDSLLGRFGKRRRRPFARDEVVDG
jgi:hypothetical protein